jgi:Flp pilus assembly pilin Flp
MGRRPDFQQGCGVYLLSLKRRTLMLKRLRKNQKGAALLEYTLLIAGIALIGAAAVAVFGHKTTDMMAAVAAVLPGAHADDNAPIVSGKIIETAVGTGNGDGATNAIALDMDAILAASDGTQVRLGNRLGTAGTAVISDLVLEPNVP